MHTIAITSDINDINTLDKIPNNAINKNIIKRFALAVVDEDTIAVVVVGHVSFLYKFTHIEHFEYKFSLKYLLYVFTFPLKYISCVAIYTLCA